MTVSTCGVVPKITQLAVDSDVSLAISLHAPNDALRNQLVPINKKYPLAVLMAACRTYQKQRNGDSITMAYVMLDGVNDEEKHARELVTLLRGISCKVNLIPFNVFPGALFQSSQRVTIERFQDRLVRAGILTTIRKSRGEDIKAACGQLKGDFMGRG